MYYWRHMFEDVIVVRARRLVMNLLSGCIPIKVALADWKKFVKGSLFFSKYDFLYVHFMLSG